MKKNLKKEMIKMKKLVLDLDEIFGDIQYPQTQYDIGGLGHYIIINAKDKNKAIDEMVAEFRERLDYGFEEEEEEE